MIYLSENSKAICLEKKSNINIRRAYKKNYKEDNWNN